MRDYVLTLLVAAAVTYLLTPLVRRVAISAGAMFEPRERDMHTVPVPRGGGVPWGCARHTRRLGSSAG